MGQLSLRDQLRIAFEEKVEDEGWTMARLLHESGLTCDRSSLDRKINGHQLLRTEECQALADALARTVAWTGHASKRHGKRRGHR